MSALISWTITNANENPAANANSLLHYADCTTSADDEIQSFINQLIEHTMNIIPPGLRDDARYLLFDWDCDSAILTVTSTNDDKTRDAPDQISSCLQNWRNPEPDKAEEHTASLRYWIRDYLTTCPAFLSYALIAVFCEGDRSQARLL